MSSEKTLAELRRECRKHGIKVRMKTFSFGPSVRFEIDGVSASSVITKEHYDKNRDAFEALKDIKKRFYGMEINGGKVVGLK